MLCPYSFQYPNYTHRISNETLGLYSGGLKFRNIFGFVYRGSITGELMFEGYIRDIKVK